MIMRYALASVCGGLALFMSAPASSATFIGPVYPPPGGVTFTSNGIPSIQTGRVASYQNFDLNATDQLYFSYYAAGLAMDGSINTPSESLSFDAANSDLANGLARYIGSTTINSFGVNQTVFTRLTLSFTDAVTSAALALALDPTINGGLTPALDVLGNFNVAQAFTASSTLNGSYIAAATYFNNTPGTPNVSNLLQSSLSGGFYYTENPTVGGVPEPATWAMMLLGFGAVGMSFRRKLSVDLRQAA